MLKKEKRSQQKEENLFLREKVAYKNSEVKDLRIAKLKDEIIEFKKKIPEIDILNVK